MCEKGILIWTCGCTHLQDPRFCRNAIFRKKPCDGYGFSWAYRSPIPLHTLKKCPSCLHAEEVRKAQLANEASLATSSAYPTLQSVANGDDSRREGRGRPRFDRVASEEEICVPEGWRPEMNRLPGNANEYSAWLGGRFDPLVRLEDTHQPSPRVARPQSSLPARAARAQEIPAQQVQHRVCSGAETGAEQETILYWEGVGQRVGSSVEWDFAATEGCGYCAAFPGAFAAVEGLTIMIEDYSIQVILMEREEVQIGVGGSGCLTDDAMIPMIC
ncbi:hypothetical protein E4T42_03075 [Aureobasidium subglaciale]|nr:hypothetical protein E4T42_03075 [Aureobasidium subglaciale]